MKAIPPILRLSTRPLFLLAALLLLAAWPARADQYRGNGITDFGGAIGNGTLTLSDDGTNISGTLSVGDSMYEVLVLYIQSGPGGFADTSGFNDQADMCRQAISGVSPSRRSLLTFASGCQPNYAIALFPANGTAGLWQLANGSDNSLVYLGSVNLAPLNSFGPYTFSFPAALIGMIPGVRSTIQLFGTYIGGGFRSAEAIAGNLAPTPGGWDPFTQTAYANYTFDAGAVLIKLPSGLWAQGASSGAPAPRYYHTAVWTGNEMIVWGGAGTSGYLNSGGRYNPVANTWTALPTTSAPTGRMLHSAVWTGNEMIVWGGFYYSGGYIYLNDGGRYSPTANSWTALPTTGAPAARRAHTAVWTGSEMIVWGGYNGSSYSNDGARYSPTANLWTALTTSGAPSARNAHTAVWTGGEMIVWGGGSSGVFLKDGGRFNPTANSWTVLPTSGAPAARSDHTAVWTGGEMIIWGGLSDGGQAYLNDGGRYNPTANSWTALPTAGAPAPRDGHTALWSGSEMIVWGGIGNNGNLNNGGRFSSVFNSWTALATTGAPTARYLQTVLWSGSSMILFGGYGSGGVLSDTWSYYPYAPAVRISRSTPASAVVAWPVWYPTLRLCQTTNVAAGQWTTLTNAVTQVGSENHVTLSPLSGRQFFRAVYP
jgi:N-acetylneuraminic acid mutarotase